LAITLSSFFLVSNLGQVFVVKPVSQRHMLVIPAALSGFAATDQ